MADAVVVIGAGPAGLATAALLGERGIATRVLDRTGVPGGAYARMEPTIQLTTPADLIDLPGLALTERDRGDYVSAAAYHRYLVRYAAHHRIVPEAAEVVAIAPDLTITVERGALAGALHARAVVLATGMFDHPVRPAIPGLPADGPADPTRPAVMTASAWRDDRSRRGRSVVIVGAASSGVEIAEAEATAGARVIVAARDRVRIIRQTVLGVDPARLLFPLLARTPPWLLPEFCAGERPPPGVDHGFTRLRKAGRIDVRPGLARVAGRRAVFADGTIADVDAIVLACGYRHEQPLLTAAVAGDARVAVAGHPCAYTAASQYLYGIARDARRIAETLEDSLSSAAASPR